MPTSEIGAQTPQARFQAELERHRGIAFKVAHTYCRHAEDRRDLLQEIAAQLWRAYPRYDPSRPFSTWMYRIALNVAISFARRAGRRLMQPLPEGDGIPAPSEETSADDLLPVLERVLAGLDDLHRALVVLYLDDLSYREIGEVLGISESNVGTKINRLKAKIRAEYGE